MTMWKRCMGLGIAVTIVLASASSALPGYIAQASDGDSNRILLEWEWRSPPYGYRVTTTVGGDGRTYTRVELEGYPNGAAPGWPSLPMVGKLVALPPRGDFAVEVIEVEYDTVPLAHPVEPAPAPAPQQLDLDAPGQPRPGGWTFTRDERAYTGSAPYPAGFVTLDEPAWMRDTRLARLSLAPFRYHPDRRTLDVVRRLRLRVVQVGGAVNGISGNEWKPSSASSSVPTSGAIPNLLNPADVETFRAPEFAAQQVTRPTHPQLAGDYKVIVSTEGLYALDRSTLAAAGVPVGSINPATLRLIHAGHEIAAQWEGDDDDAFEAGERLLFYARPQPTRYAGYDVYWLAWGGQTGRRMSYRAGSPTGLSPAAPWATLLAEENTAYDSLYPDRSGDRWFWRQLKRPDAISDTFTLTLETPAAGTTADLTVWLQGFTRAWPDPDHHVRFTLNGINLGDAWWEAKTAYTATMSLPTSLLAAGDNALVLSLPGDTGSNVEGTWVDAIQVTYGLSAVSDDVARFRGHSTPRAYTVAGFTGDGMRVYDVTDPIAPLVVTGWTLEGGVVTVGDAENAPAEYLALTEEQIQTPSAILAAKPFADPPQGADYVVVTHPDFEAALTPLVDHRVAQGLRVTVADVEAIYDHFGDGRMDPTAIRSFLSYAYANWPAPAPLYVLLVGDATYDPRGYLPDSSPTYLPPYLGDVDPWIGETASDRWYADLSGDVLPDLRLGRLPVNTPEEVQAVVEKIVSYEARPLRERWNERLLFGADNPSTAGDHHADSDSEFNIYATPAYGRVGVRVYLSETGGAPYLYTDAETAQDALIAEFDQGALLYTYFGHASWHQEAVLETDNYAPLFHVDHVARLNNQRRWPMVLHMTCFTGYYVHRTDDTLDESLLRADGVGAVAVWGASGNGLVEGHHVLHHSFYSTVFDDQQVELGAATHAALTTLYPYAGGAYNDLIDTYHLFGDPAMKLNLTVVELPFSLFLPVIARGA